MRSLKAGMHYLRSLCKGAGAGKKRYAATDYGPYFDRPVINGRRLERAFLGKLALPGGFVVACDPLLGLHDALPFTRRMSPGEYPVFVVRTGHRHCRHNALIKITFADKQAVQWELATVPGNHRRAGFTAEAGIGCLCDAHTQKHYNRYLERFFREHPDANIYDTLFDATFGRPGQVDVDGNCFNFFVPSRPRLNVIMFSTGYGDGIYPAYWGIAKDGEVCSFVIDLMVL